MRANAVGLASYRFLRGLKRYCETVAKCCACVKRNWRIPQGAAQQFQIIGDLAIDRFQLFDPAHTVHDGGVIAAPKPAADLGQGPAGQLLGQIHRHLARAGIVAHPLRANHIGQADVVMLGHLALDFLDRDLAIRSLQHIGQTILGQLQVDLAAHKRGKGKQTGQRAFQNTHVGRNAVGQKFQHTRRNRQAGILAR